MGWGRGHIWANVCLLTACPNAKLIPDGREKLTHSSSVQTVCWKPCGGNKRQADSRAWGVIRVEHKPLWGCTHPKLTKKREGPGHTKPSQGPWLLAKCTLHPELLFVHRAGGLSCRSHTWILECSGIMTVLRTHLSLVTDRYVPGAVYISSHHISQQPWEAGMIYPSCKRKTQPVGGQWRIWTQRMLPVCG